MAQVGGIHGCEGLKQEDRTEQGRWPRWPDLTKPPADLFSWGHVVEGEF